MIDINKEGKIVIIQLERGRNEITYAGAES